ncbi:MAG: OadG family protein [Oscillospiraceae bacterium]|nr:OadG family protein [Oscillospiraceae bacterium]
MEYSNLFVVLMGVGTVFVGLICLIVLVSLMGWLCRKTEKTPAAPPAAAPAAADARSNAGEIVAAISAAIAQESGTDVSAIRIVSIKRI